MGNDDLFIAEWLKRSRWKEQTTEIEQLRSKIEEQLVWDIAGFSYFREWRRACITDRGTKGEELSDEYWGFRSVQNEGITVISRLPFKTEDILCVCEEAEEWNVDRGNSKAQTYRPVSDIYEVTEESPDSYYAIVMQVSADFEASYEDSLYILSRNKETGKVKIMKYISSQEELNMLPEDESNRDYIINTTYPKLKI